jgi:hypothetical protein
MSELTYGEAHTKYKFDVNGWEYAFDEVPPLQSHKPRMKKNEAVEYYSKKFRKFFGMDEVTLREFDGSIECCYDYHEAQKIKNQILGE